MISSPTVHDAIIVGAGYGGLGAGAQLQRAGISDFVILERADRIGGVWRDNTYPGAACDTQSIIYCYTYFPHLSVTRMFSEQPELLGYLEALAAEYDLTGRIRLGSEVTAATWLEDRGLWEVTTAAGETHLGRAFVPAWGQLGVPFIPDFPGMADFTGTMFHSAHWDHDVDLAGLRVASIGNAASAVQYVPEVAEEAGRLTVFQRSANYLLPRNQEVFDEERRRGFQADPAVFEALRTEIHTMRENGFQRVRHATSEQATGVAEARAHLENQVRDPALREKLTPDYEFGCKRILRTDDYYPALMRDNVELVTEGIAEFTPTGIRTVDGEVREFDVVVFGTGFKSQAFHAGMRITGRAGVSLDERWGDAPEAFFGLSVDGFPNMFLVYGPNTNLNHNSIVTMMEVQHEFIVAAVQRLREHPGLVIDVRPDVVAAHNDEVQAELANSAYSSDCSSWYKNAAGRVVNNWHGTVEEYRTAVAAISPADYGLASWEPEVGAAV
ncbi:NAD(P)-binding domain-containing protein [Leucobacter sp. CSA1]|uniref:NAD(P)-binding domain-containing protein n=1 Tax=Leucobacter chromiisoli TaxID=2796471 RepID=A0A934USP2_9MICO|nr:NAD(P)/FAD-dependent oxidoreductase [Leucobacter chromiisoli]MBK0417514.1 NAD(P)-binding domain-containing protein [Leucobacter chromiisoli]